MHMISHFSIKSVSSVVERLWKLGWGNELDSIAPTYADIRDHHYLRQPKDLTERSELTSISNSALETLDLMLYSVNQDEASYGLHFERYQDSEAECRELASSYWEVSRGHHGLSTLAHHSARQTSIGSSF